jgi:hypothetical protein
VVPRFLFAALLSFPALGAATWTDYRTGPLHVISDAGDKAARERLTEMEQLRHQLGVVLGKDNLDLVWPLNLVLFPNQREYAPHALPQPMADGGSATLAAWMGDTALPRDFLRALTLQLIENNAGRMPEATETALCDLFSTLQVNGTRVALGAPLAAGELPPARLAAWAKLQMLATQPEYSPKLRVYLNNLQQGGNEDVATHNAFDISAVELNRRADAYLRAGNFTAAPVSGEAINPNRDFVEKQVPEAAVNQLFAELKNAGKDFPPESARGLLARATNRPTMRQAAEANPRWAEPHAQLADLEVEPEVRITELKTAATLEPRNSAYWRALAVAQADAKHYADADKSWNLAERNAVNDQERARLHQARIDMDGQRATFEIAERKRLAEDRIADIERVRNAALAEVHAAEDAANKKMGGLKPGETVVPWWTDADGQKLSGTLTKIDCLKGPLRLTVKPDSGAAVQVLIRDQKTLTMKGSGEATFGCGVQKPARKVNLVYNGKPDPSLGTAGDVSMLEFP